MKRVIYYLNIILILTSVGCANYDDTELWKSVNSLEQRVSAMETVTNAYKNKLYIKSVDNITNGYIITFSDNSKATIINGKDGKDGENGETGEALIDNIIIGEDEVTFNLTDNRSFSVPFYSALSISFEKGGFLVAPNTTQSLHYAIHTVLPDIEVAVISSSDIRAKIVTEDDSNLTGTIQISTGNIVDEQSKVVVFVSNGERMIMRSITFEEPGIEIADNAIKEIGAKGGDVVLEFLSNVECRVIIPNEAKSWISVVPDTRALDYNAITLKLKANEGYGRNAVIKVESIDASLSVEYTVKQKGELGDPIDPSAIPNNEIWYVTKSKVALQLNDKIQFGANIVSNTYQNIGKLRFDGDVTTINSAGWNDFFLTDWKELTMIILPQSITSLVGKPFKENTNLSEFQGKFASEDGRCLVVDGVLHSFAPYGLEEYATPEGVTVIGESAFVPFTDLKKIVISEGVMVLEPHAIQDNTSGESKLEEVYLPSTLKSMGFYPFLKHKNIKKFRGDSDFISADGYSLIVDNYAGLGRFMFHFASGAGLTEYTIPEGVDGIQNYCFYGAESLTSLTFPKSVITIGPSAFEDAYNIEKIYGPNVLADNRSYVVNKRLLFIADKGLTEYTTPESVEILGDRVFSRKQTMEKVIISDNVRSVEGYGYLFERSYNIKDVTISARMEKMGYDPFNTQNNKNFKAIYLRTPFPPYIQHNLYSDIYIENEFVNLTIYVPKESLDAYMASEDWQYYRKYFKGYDYGDLSEFYPDYYYSTDYSQDGVVKTLQTATKGNGIDIVLMGDAYSDRQIAGGLYKRDMETLYNNLFTEEPYKSYKELFNVYYVNVVSATEGYDHNKTALKGYFGHGTFAGGNDAICFEYAQKAIDEKRMDEVLVIVAMNANRYAGTCFMYDPENATGDYSSGASVAYFPKVEDISALTGLLHHEANGHGFAKLADEYAYEANGRVPVNNALQYKTQQSDWGWWKNVDFTNNPTTIRWSHFLKDARYKNEGLGVYEGGLTYWEGVWRPTENSIMRYNSGGFNAPSREAIYYRIHKLAYGDSWRYDYEDFAKYDAVNRKTAASAYGVPYRQYDPLHPPVVKNRSWRDAE